MTLLERTKTIAKQRGLSLTDTALKAGLAEKSIYSWDRSNPKSENLQKVADVLNVSTDYLLGRSNDPTPKNTNQTDLKTALENNNILSFDGKPISEKYKRIILELLSEEDD
jgi:transcriptional regulator with XRE-family HTH domain